jgi:transcriptional regulator with XRE-family HTH domain
LPEKWTGNLVGKMHNAKVTKQQLADQAGVSLAYVSMILSGSRKPKDGREKLEKAFNDIVNKKEA